jgi:hypothetical protein
MKRNSSQDIIFQVRYKPWKFWNEKVNVESGQKIIKALTVTNPWSDH